MIQSAIKSLKTTLLVGLFCASLFFRCVKWLLALIFSSLTTACIAVLVFGIYLVLVTECAEASPCDHTTTEFNCVFFKHNHDGDTITVDIPNVHPLMGQGIPIRVLGIDAPELNSSNPCEKYVAELAKVRTQELLSTSTRVDLQNAKRGSFFRIVADVILDGVINLGNTLMVEGLATTYKPYKTSVDWCKNTHYLKYSKSIK